MQKPIRYYITKSGEEPTVRSVTVALPETPRDDRSDATSRPKFDHVEPEREKARPVASVKRRVKDAIRKRSSRQ
jgi:hypothetical protein